MPKTIEGYAAVFYRAGDAGSEYQLAEDVVERVMPTAFDKTLASAADVTALWNHNPDFLLGRRAASTLRLTKDARGLKYSIDYDADDPQHASVYAKLRRGDVVGSSFSFTVRDENVRRVGAGFVRELVDLNLIEVSPVWRPAYTSTTAGARSLPDESVRQRHDRLMCEDPEYRATWQRHRRVAQVEAELERDQQRERQRRESQAVAVRLRLLEVS